MASLLPNGRQQFADGNGTPLAGGFVYFYVPNTSTPKNTWQDAAGTILNTNPVVLDGSGEAVIYGTGSYRQVLRDSLGNLIWDQATAAIGGTVESGGSPSTGQLTIWQDAGSTITGGNLTGDVTTGGDTFTTLSAIQGTSISGTTGNGNVVLSNTPSIFQPFFIGGATANDTIAASNFLPSSSIIPACGMYDSSGGGATAVALSANSKIVANFFGPSNAVNYWQIENSASGVQLNLFASGTDPNISNNYSTQGTGTHTFYTNSAAQFQIVNTSSAVNNLTVTGGIATTVSTCSLSAVGSSGSINIQLVPKGASGVVNASSINISSSVVPQNGLFLNSGLQISTNGNQIATFGSSGDVIVGTAAITTSATVGFFWIPSCAGAPGGSPTAPYTNAAAMVADTLNNKLWVRIGTTWKGTTLS